jgi:hypothetical protein
MQSLIVGVERGNQLLDNMEWTGRRVMGFKLPEWQRKERWSDDQCENFIESIYLGANIGQFMVNLTVKPEFDRILLDGQQRLRALERYLADEISVPGEDGVPVFWSELENAERAHLYRIGFPWLATEYLSEDTLAEAYNRHNFGGTAHLETEKAPVENFKSSAPGYHG